MFDITPPYPNLNFTSVITYGHENAPLGDGMRTLDKYDVFPDLELEPIQKEDMYEAEEDHTVFALFHNYNNGLRLISFNNVTYQPPLVPTIFSAVSEPDALIRNASLYGPTSGADVIDRNKPNN